MGSAAAAEPWAGRGKRRLGRTRAKVLPKHPAVGLTRRAGLSGSRSLSCGLVSRCACIQGGGSRGPAGPCWKRSSDTTAAGARPPSRRRPCSPSPSPAGLRILPHGGLQLRTPPCFKDMLNVFDIEHISPRSSVEISTLTSRIRPPCPSQMLGRCSDLLPCTKSSPERGHLRTAVLATVILWTDCRLGSPSAGPCHLQA